MVRLIVEASGASQQDIIVSIPEMVRLIVGHATEICKLQSSFNSRDGAIDSQVMLITKQGKFFVSIPEMVRLIGRMFLSEDAGGNSFNSRDGAIDRS